MEEKKQEKKYNEKSLEKEEPRPEQVAPVVEDDDDDVATAEDVEAFIRDRRERHIQGGNVAGRSGEHIVQVDVAKAEDDEGNHPVVAREHGSEGSAHPLDEAELGEAAGERNDRAEPHNRIPGSLVTQNILPGNGAGDEQEAEEECPILRASGVFLISGSSTL